VSDERETQIRVERAGGDKRGARGVAPEMDVRDEDMEPHEGLRYIARLFKVLSILLILLLIGEAVLGLRSQGGAAIPRLLVEATRLIVFAGFLWGAADMALMFIESNHDLRAARILVGRVNGRLQRLEQAQFGAVPTPPAGGPARPASAPPPTGGTTPPPGF
jgi:hypothetical protein